MVGSTDYLKWVCTNPDCKATYSGWSLEHNPKLRRCKKCGSPLVRVKEIEETKREERE